MHLTPGAFSSTQEVVIMETVAKAAQAAAEVPVADRATSAPTIHATILVVPVMGHLQEPEPQAECILASRTV